MPQVIPLHSSFILLMVCFENILDDKLKISNNINVQLVNKVFIVNKKEGKVKNKILKRISLVRALMELK